MEERDRLEHVERDGWKVLKIMDRRCRIKDGDTEQWKERNGLL